MDVDGVERIDFANNMASLIHGHAHPAVVDAVSSQLRRGTAFTMATEAEVRFAEHLCNRVPGFDKIRFVNSGTEAVMAAIKASRAFTHRPKIAKFEGAYHGSYDYAEISQTSGPSNWGQADCPASVPVAQGTPQGALQDVVILPFNDPARALRILNAQAERIACVLVDPLPHRIGLIPASGPFIDTLHAWTRGNGALLIFDEVITFRSHYGGAQEAYDVCPDLTALGKIIGGGFPVGALAGREEVMAVLDPTRDDLPLPHSGTFSANPVTMTAGRVTMELFGPEEVKHLNRLGDYARGIIGESIRVAQVPAAVTGAGSMFRLHLKDRPPIDYRGCYTDAEQKGVLEKLLNHLFESGFMLINTCSGALSTAMTKAEIDRLAEALLAGLRKIKPLL
jgi:glutamate-1-semialdehyde 2,1-aminomutase